MKFGVRVRTWDTLPALNFVKIAQGICPLRDIFYLSPYFYTDNVKILRNRTEDLEIHQRHKISSESLKGPAGIALPSGGDAY